MEDEKVIIGLFLVVFSFCFVSASFSEEMSVDTKWRLYTSESKNPWIAVGAAWLVPTMGHAYAGNWGRGLPFLGVEAASLAVMVSSISSTGSSVNASQYGLGLGVLLVARVWEYMDAYATAEDANKELKTKYGVGFMLRNDLPVLALNYRF